MAKRDVINTTDMVEAGMLGMMAGPEAAIRHLNHRASERDDEGWEMIPTPDNKSRTALEKAGVVFGQKVNNIFTQVRYPDGWKVIRTDHYMYTRLCDASGKVRADIGLKVIDNWGSCHAVTRLRPDYMRDCWLDRDTPLIPIIRDSNQNVLWRGKPRTGDKSDKCREEATKVLTKAYPDWENLDAYWDIDKFDKLPPNASEPPKGNTYTAHTTYYDSTGENISDSGVLGTTIKESDAEAIEFFKKVLDKSTSTCKVKILHDDKVVGEFWTREPKRERITYSDDYGGFYRRTVSRSPDDLIEYGD